MADLIAIGGNLIEVAQISDNTVTIGATMIEVVYSSPDDTVYIGSNLIEVAIVRVPQDKYKYQAFLI